MTPVRDLAELTRAECLQLLGSVPFGRVVFTSRALPAVRPVNHLLIGQQIIIRASLGAAISSAVDGAGTVVAYEADLIDPDQRTGWSVVVVGRANRVASATLAARYRESLSPWIDEQMDEVITIAADLVTGYRMAARPVKGSTAPVAEIPAVRRPAAVESVTAAERG
jgi:Pyridoxamine 5'-phosphate oxidase